MDANQTSYELKDELARFCLPSANRDASLKLAWVNSICILFLIIGIFGARRGRIHIKPVPPIQEIIPVVVEPMTLPPQATVKKNEQPNEEKSKTPQVVAVTLPSPNINFSVPTIGSLVVPAALATAPPLETPEQISSVNSTGSNGERPEPDYPVFFRQMGEQGMIVVLIHGDAAGNVISVDVKKSTGFPALDHYTTNFIKNNWHLPIDTNVRLFEFTVNYKLQLN